MADEIPINALPAASALVGTEIFPLVQGGVTKKAALDSLSDFLPFAYPFVVGSTGNYPATAAGLQDACDDALAAAGGGTAKYVVFVQSGSIPSGTVTLSGTPIIVGAKDENISDLFENLNGVFTYKTNISSAALTIIQCTLIFPGSSGGNGTGFLYNICYAPNSEFFTIPDEESNQNIYLENCCLISSSSAVFCGGKSGNDTSVLNVFYTNTYQYTPILLNIFTISSGTVNINIDIDSNSLLVDDQGSTLPSNVNGKITVQNNSIFIGSVNITATEDSSLALIFSDCTIGMVNDLSLVVNDGSFDQISINQQNVQYIGDISCSNVPIFDDVDGIILVPGNPFAGNKISLMNCNWGSSLDTQFNAAYTIDNNGALSTPTGLYTKTAEVLPLGFDKRAVDGVAVASTILFSPDNDNYTNVCPIGIMIKTEEVTGYVSAPTISIGNNGTSYDNILSATALTLNASNQSIFILIPTVKSILCDGTAIRCKVTVGAVSTIYSMRIQLINTFA